MNALLLADLHLTAHARDDYRWRLFPWLVEAIAKHGVTFLIILGDLTESKDYHSARLVNRIVDELVKLNVRIIIVPGNHDGIDPGCPYFRFLGQFEQITYHQTIFIGPLLGKQVLFLPHTKEPEAWPTDVLQAADVIFMHQTVAGAKSETGMSLEGMTTQVLTKAARRAKIWSGDIHVPQVIGPVEYVGAPYPVRFGDKFKPRAVLLSDGLKKATDLPTPAFARLSLTIDLRTDLDDVPLVKGDQVKFKVRMTKAEFVEWDKLKRSVTDYCNALGVELCGLEVEKVEEAPRVPKRGSAPVASRTPSDLLAAWGEKQGLEKPLVDAGQQILASVVK